MRSAVVAVALSTRLLLCGAATVEVNAWGATSTGDGGGGGQAVDDAEWLDRMPWDKGHSLRRRVVAARRKLRKQRSAERWLQLARAQARNVESSVEFWRSWRYRQVRCPILNHEAQSHTKKSLSSSSVVLLPSVSSFGEGGPPADPPHSSRRVLPGMQQSTPRSSGLSFWPCGAAVPSADRGPCAKERRPTLRRRPI